MKTKITSLTIALSLFVAGMLMNAPLCAQTFGTQNSGISDNANQIEFATESIGWAVADAGRIIGTADGGLNWNLLSSGVTTDLFSIDAVSMTTAMAVGANGVILTTTNGGITWTPQTSGTANDLMGIHMVDANTAYAVGATGTILKTTDGGAAWSALTSGTTNDLNGVHFISSTNGYAVGGGLLSGTILVTFNAGVNWTTQTSGTTNAINSVFFTDANNGYAVCDLGTVLKTTDGGTNWNSQTVGANNLTDVAFVNDSIGFISGNGSTLMRTDDYGAGWNAVTTGGSGNHLGLSFLNQYTGYLSGTAGEVLKTCPTTSFSVSPNDTICEGASVDFINESFSASSYIWRVNTDTVASSMNLTHTFDTAATYQVDLIADNGTCESMFQWDIVALDGPEVSLGNDTVVCSTCSVTLDAGNAGSTYLWYVNGTFSGNTAQTHVASSTAEYVVQVTNADGCTDSDTIFVQVTVGIGEWDNGPSILLYPNPANDVLNIELESDSFVWITDALGRTVQSVNAKMGVSSLTVSKLEPGIYYVSVQANGKSTVLTQPIVIQ